MLIKVMFVRSFKVVEKCIGILYAVQESPRRKPRVVHHDKLKQYRGRNLPADFLERERKEEEEKVENGSKRNKRVAPPKDNWNN